MTEEPSTSAYVELAKLLFGGDPFSMAMRVIIIVAATGLVVAVTHYKRSNRAIPIPKPSIGLVKHHDLTDRRIQKNSEDIAGLTGRREDWWAKDHRAEWQDR